MKDVKVKYVVLDGYHLKKAQAKPLIDVLQTKFNGRKPTEDELIDEAKKKGSPIHHLFNWNVQEAAYAHWKERAQYYLRAIGSVYVSIKTEKIVRGPVRYSVPVEYVGHKAVQYQLTERLNDTPENVDVVLGRMLADMQAWASRYDGYLKLLKYKGEITSLLKGLKLRATKISKGLKHAE